MKRLSLLNLILALAVSAASGCAHKGMAADAAGDYAAEAPAAQMAMEDAAYRDDAAAGPMMASLGSPASAPAPALMNANMEGASGSKGGSRANAAGDEDIPDANHMLIFDGSMQLREKASKLSATIDAIIDIAEASGGYVSHRTDQQVQVRVPSKRFRPAMREVADLAEVISQSVQTQDVSEEYHDLEVRLQSMKATRARIEGFLERASNIEEILRLEAELSRIAGEIDRVEGRMRFLSSRVAFSTINVGLTPIPDAPVEIASGGEPPPPPPPSTLQLPIEWIPEVGLDRLLSL